VAQNLTPSPTGTEFHVNAALLDQYQPTVAALAGGGYVVAWTSFTQDGSGGGVYAQRYSAGGVALGTEFQVNTTTLNSQYLPKTAALADGGFVVTWVSFLQDGSGEGVYAQRYAADGSAAGAEFRVNTTTLQDQLYPSVTALAGGGFLVRVCTRINPLLQLGFRRRAVEVIAIQMCAASQRAQDAGVRHWPGMVRLGRSAPYVSRPAQKARLFRVQTLKWRSSFSQSSWPMFATSAALIPTYSASAAGCRFRCVMFPWFL
jgi:hypothetical protein